MCSWGKNKILAFKNQNYKVLYDDHINKEELFDDHEFGPASWTADGALLSWARAKDLHHSPILLGTVIDRDGIVQGPSAAPSVASLFKLLATHPLLVNQIIPNAAAQSWDWLGEEFHPGIFEFNFWRLGKWYSVVVDDKIPIRNRKPLFTYVKDGRQFWCSLLEKAYAKFCGSYSALHQVSVTDMISELTGGVCVTKLLVDEGYKTDVDGKKKLYREIADLLKQKALLLCYIPKIAGETTNRTKLGILKDYYYPVLNAAKIFLSKNIMSSFSRNKPKIYLLRLKQPACADSGEEQDYLYSVSHLIRRSTQSRDWGLITEDEYSKLGLEPEKDDEFWIPVDDFLETFTRIIMNCSSYQKMKERVCPGEWTVGSRGTVKDRSGGCIRNHNTFLNNPQFCVSCKVDEKIIVQLGQHGAAPNMTDICLYIMQVELNRKYRVHRRINAVQCGPTDCMRYIIMQLQLSTGRYIIIPTTANPGVQKQFVIRVLSLTDLRMKELTKDQPSGSFWCFTQFPKLASSVHVKAISEATQPAITACAQISGCGLFVILRCGRKKVMSLSTSLQSLPEKNFKAVFYRKSQNSTIYIEVWSKRAVLRKFLARGEFCPRPQNNPKEIKVTLYEEEKNNVYGTATVEVYTTDTLSHI